ncbi:copper chaperone PCu(A)C [Saccharomonospora xinjiangensis]|uniref:Copper(I)-binding protein n=1 Tax=Saccharomonospora xinjiangensis XJ-54 TaxID=882086 RepID=I0V2L8_9PSEU|nr:copper chaperone PCu(A)C [Saccharomonospora xinjiangensis]EID54371.1 hypothetical protein SacxiDRAFT_2139 [Saccharomonospora xinjiangensis XJ-54]
MRSSRTRIIGVAGVSALALLLSGCGAAETAAPDPGKDASDGASALTLKDGWAKASDGHMTGVFGTLTNGSDADVRVVEMSSPVAGTGELHETVGGMGGGGPKPKMREKEGGFVVLAGGEYVLEPGGDHLMLMDLSEPVLAGQDVPVTLTAEDGSTVEFTVVARSFSGANESYDGGH